MSCLSGDVLYSRDKRRPCEFAFLTRNESKEERLTGFYFGRNRRSASSRCRTIRLWELSSRMTECVSFSIYSRLVLATSNCQYHVVQGLARLIQAIKGEAEARAAASHSLSPTTAPAQASNHAAHVPALAPAVEPPRPKLSITTNPKVAPQDPHSMKRTVSGEQQPVPRSPGRALSRRGSTSRPQSPFAGSPALRVERDQQQPVMPMASRPEPESPPMPIRSNTLDRNEMPLPARRRDISGQSIVPSNPLVNVYGLPTTGNSSGSLLGSKTVAGATTSNKSPSEFADRIRVCVRKRPLNRKELKRKENDITAIIGRRNLIINEPKWVLESEAEHRSCRADLTSLSNPQGQSRSHQVHRAAPIRV